MTPPRTTNGVLRYRVDELQRDLKELQDKYDRLVMAAVVAAFTFAASILLLAVNLIVLRKN